jgi:hypothetical protein
MGDSKYEILFRWDIQVIQYSLYIFRVLQAVIQEKHEIRYNTDFPANSQAQ